MKTNTIWALVTGLAVGYIVGREFTKSGSSPGSSESASASSKPAGGGSGSTAIPAGWIKEDEFGATAQFADLNAQQKFAALKVLNEKPCDCGCPHGSVAKCKKEDPGCPRAPQVIAQAVAMAKQGKTPEEILAAVKKPDAPAQAAQQPPAGQPQKIELAAWTPVKGPKTAKVTIIEFSDFQ